MGDSEFVSSPSPMNPDAMTEAKFIRSWELEEDMVCWWSVKAIMSE